MAIARVSNELYTPSGAETTVDVEYTLASGITLSLLFVGSRASTGVTELPSWNGTEDFTLITNVDGGANNYDAAIAVYGLVNPTAATADIDYTMGSSQFFYHALLNYSGTIATSVANATNVIEEVNNQGNVSTTVFADDGTSGRTTVLGATMADGAGDPASNDASMTEIYDGGIVGCAYYVAENIGGAPHAVTITWAATNENAGIFIELIPAASGGNRLLLLNSHKTGGQL